MPETHDLPPPAYPITEEPERGPYGPGGLAGGESPTDAETLTGSGSPLSPWDLRAMQMGAPAGGSLSWGLSPKAAPPTDALLDRLKQAAAKQPQDVQHRTDSHLPPRHDQIMVHRPMRIVVEADPFSKDTGRWVCRTEQTPWAGASCPTREAALMHALSIAKSLERKGEGPVLIHETRLLGAQESPSVEESAPEAVSPPEAPVAASQGRWRIRHVPTADGFGPWLVEARPGCIVGRHPTFYEASQQVEWMEARGDKPEDYGNHQPPVAPKPQAPVETPENPASAVASGLQGDAYPHGLRRFQEPTEAEILKHGERETVTYGQGAVAGPDAGKAMRGLEGGPLTGKRSAPQEDALAKAYEWLDDASANIRDAHIEFHEDNKAGGARLIMSISGAGRCLAKARRLLDQAMTRPADEDAKPRSPVDRELAKAIAKPDTARKASHIREALALLYGTSDREEQHRVALELAYETGHEHGRMAAAEDAARMEPEEDLEEPTCDRDPEPFTGPQPDIEARLRGLDLVRAGHRPSSQVTGTQAQYVDPVTKGEGYLPLTKQEAHVPKPPAPVEYPDDPADIGKVFTTVGGPCVEEPVDHRASAVEKTRQCREAGANRVVLTRAELRAVIERPIDPSETEPSKPSRPVDGQGTFSEEVDSTPRTADERALHEAYGVFSQPDGFTPGTIVRNVQSRRLGIVVVPRGLARVDGAVAVITTDMPYGEVVVRWWAPDTELVNARDGVDHAELAMVQDAHARWQRRQA